MGYESITEVFLLLLVCRCQTTRRRFAEIANKLTCLPISILLVRQLVHYSRPIDANHHLCAPQPPITMLEVLPQPPPLKSSGVLVSALLAILAAIALSSPPVVVRYIGCRYFWQYRCVCYFNFHNHRWYPPRRPNHRRVSLVDGRVSHRSLSLHHRRSRIDFQGRCLQSRFRSCPARSVRSTKVRSKGSVLLLLSHLVGYQVCFRYAHDPI